MDESKVYLQHGKSGELVEASLFDEITSDHLKLWNDGWLHALKIHCMGIQLEDRPEDSHWDWNRKIRQTGNLLSYQSFALVCEGDLQGLMLCRDLASARLPGQFGKPMVHLDFIATAPWNRREFQQPVRFKGCGRIFILAAIEVSRASGGKGRIGLHSLPAAEEFYERMCGMTRLGSDAAHQNLVYFEMTETQADLFRTNQTNP